MQHSSRTSESAGGSKAPRDIFETLLEALSHSDTAVRESAIREFAQRKDKRGITPLLELLSDKEASVRQTAANALIELGWKPGTEEQQARHAVALQHFQEASSLGQSSVEPLLKLLQDKEAALRLAALEVLAQIGSPRIFNPILGVLKDENPQVRAVAAQVLSRLNDVRAIEFLAKLVKDTSWEVRSVVVDALEHCNSPERADAIIGFLNDESPDLRLRSCELLGKLEDKRAISALVAALVDADHTVRSAALRSLAELDKNWHLTEHAKAAVPAILPALKHHDDSIREQAADALRLIGQTRAMNSFLTAETGTASRSAVPVLIKALKATNRDLRQASAEALGRLGDASALGALVETLVDEDQWVREAALYALNLLNWKPANDTELVLKSVILQRWETAVLFDSVAFEPLVMVLNSEDPEVCKAAISSLAQIGDKRACEPLAAMLYHPHKQVRAAAAHGLRILEWLPRDAKESVIFAIELQDWKTASQHGAAAVEPLVGALKENFQNLELNAAVADALSNIMDGHAVRPLLSYSRDGQLSETIIVALTNIVEQNVGEVEDADLKALCALSNIFQFRYTYDERYGSYVRSGLQEVDTSRLKKQAAQELARRGASL